MLASELEAAYLDQYPALLRFVRSLTLPSNLCPEDVLQEAFVSFFEKVDRMHGRNLKSLFFTAVRNLACTYRRRADLENRHRVSLKERTEQFDVSEEFKLKEAHQLLDLFERWMPPKNLDYLRLGVDNDWHDEKVAKKLKVVPTSLRNYQFQVRRWAREQKSKWKICKSVISRLHAFSVEDRRVIQEEVDRYYPGPRPCRNFSSLPPSCRAFEDLKHLSVEEIEKLLDPIKTVLTRPPNKFEHVSFDIKMAMNDFQRRVFKRFMLLLDRLHGAQANAVLVAMGNAEADCRQKKAELMEYFEMLQLPSRTQTDFRSLMSVFEVCKREMTYIENAGTDDEGGEIQLPDWF